MPFGNNLVYADVSKRERFVAGAVTVIICATAILVAPVADTQAGELNAFLPLVVGITAFSLLFTALALYSQYLASRHPPLAYLAFAYAAVTVLIIPYLLTFPRVFSPTGLFGSGPQTAAWLYACWHAIFLALVAAYVGSERAAARKFTQVRQFSPTLLAISVSGILVGVIVVAIPFSTILPSIVIDGHWTPVWSRILAPAILVANLGILLVLILITRLKTVVHLWLAVVLTATLAEWATATTISGGRFSYGWYFSRFEWIIAATIFYAVLQLHINRILSRLVLTNQELVETTISDELTGLLNKRGFDQRLAEAERKCMRSQTPISILMIDVDDFKHYNDSFGHPAGDRALQAIAAMFKQSVHRPNDSCGRVGGEEFAVILVDTDLLGSIPVAERILRAIERLNISQAAGCAHNLLTVSIGVACNEGNLQSSVLTLVANADAALYEAKRMGKNRISVAASSQIPQNATISPPVPAGEGVAR